MGLEKYTVLECIGEGSFGRVFRGRIKETGHVCFLLLHIVGSDCRDEIHTESREKRKITPEP